MTSPASSTATFAGARGSGVVAMIVASSALTGILTPFGQQVLPHAIRSMANSSGPWTIVAFAAIYLSGLRGWRAAALGAVSFLTMDLSFYMVFESLGLFYPRHFLAFWMVIGVLVGPVIGLCASWLRDTRPLPRSIGVAAPGAVLIGEGVFMLVRLPGESTVYAVASVIVGIALFAVLARLLLSRARLIALGTGLTIAGAITFFFVYGLIPLLLNKVVP